jgi:4-hydroxy-tetrahydrodipicolinate synthase
MRLHGVITALVTPFSAGSIDWAAWDALAERQLEAGVHGLVVCGTTGEKPTVSHHEWVALIERTVDLAGGQVPVIANCGTNVTAHTVEAVEQAAKLGADGALVVFPYYNKPNAQGLRAHVEAACRPGLPVIAYHVPGRTAQRLDTDALAELCRIPGVVGLKEATGDMELMQHLQELVEVSLLSGDDGVFPALVAMGWDGVISVLSNLAPRMTVQWYEAARTGDVETLRSLRVRLMPVIRGLFETSNPVPAKAALAAMGLCSNELRLPLAPGVFRDESLLQGLA